MTNIYVQNKDFGFLTETPITVQKTEQIDGETAVVFCNHAQAEEREIEQQVDRQDQPDIVWTDHILVCKCGAYKFEYDNEWHDAPQDGVHYE